MLAPNILLGFTRTVLSGVRSGVFEITPLDMSEIGASGYRLLRQQTSDAQVIWAREQG